MSVYSVSDDLDVIVDLLFLGLMPTGLEKHHQEGFESKDVPVKEVLQEKFSELDPDCANLIRHSVDRMPWRFYVHAGTRAGQYASWVAPHTRLWWIVSSHPSPAARSRTGYQAIGDAAALGIISSDKRDFTNSVEIGFALYEKIRK